MLADRFYRLVWYLAGVANDALSEIRLLAAPGLDAGALSVPEGFDPTVERLAAQFGGLISVVSTESDSVAQAPVIESDVVLCFSPRADFEPYEQQLREGARVFYVDPNSERNESANFLNCSSYLMKSSTRFAGASANNLAGKERPWCDEALVFGTGPSLAELPSYDYLDSTTIVCNSAVKNRSLLERLAPHVVVAADPIFHAGCSAYAGAFRAALVEALDRHRSLFFCLNRDIALYRFCLPQRLHSRIVGVDVVGGGPARFSLGDDLRTRSTKNILTLLMLPIAASFARSIGVFGCDGRPANEDDYFWGHDPASQFVDHMDGIRSVHPAFFAIDYGDYYDEHIETLNELVERIEAEGIEVWGGSNSHIPVLAARHRSDLIDDADFLIGPFDRATAHYDEVAAAAALCAADVDGHRTMIDISGGAVSPAVLGSDGWTTYVFEPDATRRQALLEQLEPEWSVYVDHRLVGGSGGVDLARFLGTNAVSDVDVVRVGPGQVAVDVLAAFPWSDFTPSAVICSFDELGTETAGPGVKELADNLASQGYALLISEWFRPVQGTVPVHYRGLRPYESLAIAPDCLGQLVAVLPEARDALVAFVRRNGVTVLARGWRREVALKGRAATKAPVASAGR